MKFIATFKEFIDTLNKQEAERKAKAELKRFRELAGLKDSDTPEDGYLIKITIEAPTDFLFEHETYTKFKKTTNRYTYHPENTDIPVKAHYHVYPAKSKKELYAVNVEDGKAHHKSNRGHLVPKKEAEELRNLGVKLPASNLLESRSYQLNEAENLATVVTFVFISLKN